MAAYVLPEPTPSADGGAAYGAGIGGLATTVVMAASYSGADEDGWEGQVDCRSVAECFRPSPLHCASRAGERKTHEEAGKRGSKEGGKRGSKEGGKRGSKEASKSGQLVGTGQTEGQAGGGGCSEGIQRQKWHARTEESRLQRQEGWTLRSSLLVVPPKCVVVGPASLVDSVAGAGRWSLVSLAGRTECRSRCSRRAPHEPLFRIHGPSARGCCAPIP